MAGWYIFRQPEDMKAKVGDWLIVERAHLDEPRRRGQIIELRHPDGEPPYLVRWEDDEEVTLVFPGPDARVVESAAAGKSAR